MHLFLYMCRGQSQRGAQASLLIGLITVIAESSAGPERDGDTSGYMAPKPHSPLLPPSFWHRAGH